MMDPFFDTITKSREGGKRVGGEEEGGGKSGGRGRLRVENVKPRLDVSVLVDVILSHTFSF